MGEWIERIGWPRFFRLTGIEFTKQHIDDFTPRGNDVQAVDAREGIAEAVMAEPVTVDELAEAMFQLVKETHGNEEPESRCDLTKAMIEKFG